MNAEDQAKELEYEIKLEQIAKQLKKQQRLDCSIVPGSTDEAVVFIVEYPEGETVTAVVLDEPTYTNNYEIAQQALSSLRLGGGITLPTGIGWKVHIINLKTGNITVVGEGK